jgi:hypothetical protein
MANIFTNFLTDFGNGVLHPKGQMGDFQHAARMFTDDTFRLAPKLKFQFHVSFTINPVALKNTALTQRHKNEINMLVKSVGLPNFTLSTDTAHQYNRKKIITTKIEYTPVTIKFHDDNMGIINQLWQNYYGYYFADSASAKVPGSYDRTAMRNGSFIKTRYGLDNNSSYPFFTKITIYQMARQDYVSYTLVNPVITSWNHESLDYSMSTVHDNSMSIGYEAVYYDQGSVRSGAVEGFAQEHYDKSPSPLSVAGGGTATLFGNGGVIAGASDVLGSVFSGKAFESPADFISTAIKTVNTYENSKKLTSAGVKEEGKKVITGALNSIAVAGLSNVNGVVIPQTGGNNTVTKAAPVNLFRNNP